MIGLARRARGSRPPAPSSSRARRAARAPASCRNCASSPRSGDRDRSVWWPALVAVEQAGRARDAVVVDRGQRRHHRRDRHRARRRRRRAPRARAAGPSCQATRGVVLEAQRARHVEVVRDARPGDDVAVVVGRDRLHRRRSDVDPDRELRTRRATLRRATRCTASCSEPVRAHEAAAVRRRRGRRRVLQRPPASSMIGTSAAMSHSDDDRVDRDVDRAFGDEQVLPEVADAARPPAPVRERRASCRRCRRRRTARAVSHANEICASSSVGDRRHGDRARRRGTRRARARPTSACRARAPTRRRRPSSPACSSPISVAQIGTPRT